jgi:hypothetical protein
MSSNHRAFLGGSLTYNYSWFWDFYINVAIGAMAFFGMIFEVSFFVRAGAVAALFAGLMGYPIPRGLIWRERAWDQDRDIGRRAADRPHRHAATARNRSGAERVGDVGHQVVNAHVSELTVGINGIIQGAGGDF